MENLDDTEQAVAGALEAANKIVFNTEKLRERLISDDDKIKPEVLKKFSLPENAWGPLVNLAERVQTLEDSNVDIQDDDSDSKFPK